MELGALRRRRCYVRFTPFTGDDEAAAELSEGRRSAAMAAFFIGIVEAPVTGIVLVMEMTANFIMLLMLAAGAARCCYLLYCVVRRSTTSCASVPRVKRRRSVRRQLSLQARTECCKSTAPMQHDRYPRHSKLTLLGITNTSHALCANALPTDSRGSKTAVALSDRMTESGQRECQTAAFDTNVRHLGRRMVIIATSYWAAWPRQWPGTHLPPSPLYPAGTQGFVGEHVCCAVGALVVGVHPTTVAIAAKPIRPASAGEKTSMSSSLPQGGFGAGQVHWRERSSYVSTRASGH